MLTDIDIVQPRPLRLETFQKDKYDQLHVRARSWPASCSSVLWDIGLRATWLVNSW
jgi:hypothetical protein